MCILAIWAMHVCYDCFYLFPILALEKNPFIMRLSYQEKDNQHMFIEDVALITLSIPYSETTRFIRPACIPIGPKFKDFGWVHLKIFSLGPSLNHVDRKGGGGQKFRKMVHVIGINWSTLGEGGSKMSKNRSIWFKDAPFACFFGISQLILGVLFV